DPVPHFGDAALDFLMSRPWRGNVRELQNVIEHVVVLAQPGAEILPDEIPVHQDWTKPADTFGMASLHNDAYHVAKEQVLATFEKEYVTRLVARAAGLANVDRTTLYRLLERHGFRRDGLGSSQA